MLSKASLILVAIILCIDLQVSNHHNLYTSCWLFNLITHLTFR